MNMILIRKKRKNLRCQLQRTTSDMYRERMGQSRISPHQNRKMGRFRFVHVSIQTKSGFGDSGIPCFQKLPLHQIQFLFLVFWHCRTLAFIAFSHWSCFFKVIRCLREGFPTGLQCFDVVCSYIYICSCMYAHLCRIIKHAALCLLNI